MKTYILFAGSCYYPSGGTGDYFDSFETLDDAKLCVETSIRFNNRYDWWEISQITDEGLKLVERAYGSLYHILL